MHLIAYAQHIRQVAPRTRLILDWHNIESEILARYAENDSNPLRAVLREADVGAVSRMSKISYCDLCDAHTVCSEREREVLLQRVPGTRIEVVGNGVDCEFFADGAAQAAKSAMCSSWAAWITTPTSTQPCISPRPPGR